MLEVSRTPSAGLKSAAGKVLSSPKASKSAKSLAASVLTQRATVRVGGGGYLADAEKLHHVPVIVSNGKANMASEKTGQKAASAAGRVLSNPKSSSAAKSAAGSALTQRGSTKETTSKAAASKAAKVLSSPTASKAAKSAAGSALTQRPGKKAR